MSRPQEEPLAIAVRTITERDLEQCAEIAFDAHQQVSARHGVPSEVPSREYSNHLLKMKAGDPHAAGYVAELDGAIVGSVFLNVIPGAQIAAIGPLTVAPGAAGGVGRCLMERVLQDAEAQGLASVRLVQSPAHLQSLALYAKAGFDVREPLVLVSDAPAVAGSAPGARPACDADVEACLSLSMDIAGFTREHELRQAITNATATVVERDGLLAGYSTGIGLRGHSIARTNDDMRALIAVTRRLPGPGFFLPIRNTDLLRWVLQGGAAMQWPAHLMTRGPYEAPRGTYLPSIAF